MKVIAKFKDLLYSHDRTATVLFQVDNYQHQRYLTELDTTKDYVIEIKQARSKRSIQQNKYMWALIRELSIKTREDDINLYLKLLESANCEFEYLWAMEESIDTLRKAFRVVKKVEPRELNDVPGWACKCYIGSSKFSTEEMNTLLDTLIMWCENENIQTDKELYNV